MGGNQNSKWHLLIVSAIMSKRERGYMELLRERREVLRTRVAAGESHKLAYVDNWRRELRAMEWIERELAAKTLRVKELALLANNRLQKLERIAGNPEPMELKFCPACESDWKEATDSTTTKDL